VAQVDGWECVVKKEEFQIGESIVYIEVDSIVPERPEFEFLRDRKFRVKTIKLRKQVSQGLVLPISVLPPGNYKTDDDVTDIIGVKKHDPQADQERLLTARESEKRSRVWMWFMRFKWFRRIFAKSKRKGGFPDWIVKTDEERIQNKMAMFDNEKALGTRFIVTEKLDGQSVTFFLKKISRRKYEFGVCSRNIYLSKPDDSSYWTIALRLNIENVLRSIIGEHDSIVLQGEILGPRIQGNKYRVSGYEFYAFNLIFPGKKVSTLDMPAYLSEYGVKTVPVLCADAALKDDIAAVVEDAKGNSVLLESQKREGVVWRSYVRNISFKAINPEFLLANDE
jgi:hypothetical protein